jgi:putative membrane-bound dehydrogenase-like protein
MKIPACPLLLLALSTGVLRAADPAAPQVLVPGLEIALFSTEPDIVTPVGIAVDAKGRVFVAESHTHQVKPGYPGPTSDRVKIYEDTNGDGRADKISVFAEGFRAAMNLAFDPDGVLHLVHRNGVVRLEDNNKDGVCDRQVPLLTLDTKEVYPHNGLSGIGFAPDGWIYVGSGENFGSVYTAVGADGTKFTYTPGGANVFRIRRDGSGLEQFATGMWNAFVLTVDGAGRVFVCDNDPDSRPPFRFLHVVQGADFGYHFQYGRSGLHPFVCWNGELPGTLPMMAGTGEAPTGILDARQAKLGADRGDGYLMTEWGDSTLAWFRLQPQGASFTASREVVIRGDTNFRPACLAAAPDGSVYLTDWADREYSVHQKGRIWRIKSTAPDKTPAARPVPPLSDAEQRRDRLAAAKDAAAWPDLKAALTDADPFILNAALTALKQPVFLQNLLGETRNPDAKVRLGALLALRRAAHPDAAPLLKEALADADAAVRRLGMIWAAELRLKDLRPLVEKALEAGGPATAISQDDFALWLAAMDLIARDAPPTAATASTSNDDLLQKLLADPATSPGIKAAVIPMLTNFKAPAMIRTLMNLATTGEPRVRQEAVRSLAFVSVKAVAAPLQKIALNPDEPASLRMDALSALAKRETAEVLPLIPLLTDQNPDIAGETVRALRMHVADPGIKPQLETLAKSAAPESVKFQAALAIGAPVPRPADDAALTAALMDRSAPASVERGRHVFFSATAMCSSCHVAEGRGVIVGPNLGNIARSSDRAKLIQSILEPSREIGPLYGTKAVTMKDGSIISGVQAIKDGGGNLNILQTGGAVVPAPRDQIVKVDETGISLMPEGLELGMTLQDFRDLLAYLETLK